MCRVICKTLLSLTPVYDSLAAMCNAYVDVVSLMSCWLLIDGVAPAATVRIDPSQFMLTQDNHRLMSAPVLSDVDAVVSQDPVLPRTPEMDDIPEHVQNVESVAPYSRLLLTASLTVLYTTGGAIKKFSAWPTSVQNKIKVAFASYSSKDQNITCTIWLLGYKFFAHFNCLQLFAYDMENSGVTRCNEMTILTDFICFIACFVVLTQNQSGGSTFHRE